MSTLEKQPLKSRAVRIFTREDLVNHNNTSSCWISRNGKVYDVTGFLQDHPGGDDLILNYAGKDVGEIMKDSDEHDHSDSAYEMLEEYCIGRLGTDAMIVDEGALCLTLQKPPKDLSLDFTVHRMGGYGRLPPRRHRRGRGL